MLIFKSLHFEFDVGKNRFLGDHEFSEILQDPEISCI